MLSSPGQSSSVLPSVAWLMAPFVYTRRATDGAHLGRAAPDPGAGATGPRLWYAYSSTPCLGDNLVFHGCGRLCTDTLCTGHSTLRSPAVPCVCLPLWRGCWCDLP